LCEDFVEPVLKPPRALAMRLARLISQASVRLLRRIESIPVWKDARVVETYRISVEYLSAGRSLLIFPEDPKSTPDPVTGMRPFLTGFARLGHAYFERIGKILKFLPVAVHATERLLELGKPIAYNAQNTVEEEHRRVAHLLEHVIRSMVLRQRTEAYAGMPLPH
jgi:hypothetical protein